MKRPGLTEAMRRALDPDGPAPISPKMFDRLVAAGLMEMGRVHIAGFGWHHVPSLTPRGQAALAAPRVTALELESLCAVERSGIRHGLGDQRLDRESWITRDYVGAPWKLTPAGTTALNNIRAASGSPEWKENV